jgi:hypothetical protein
MTKVNKTHIFNCGKCNDGEIVTTHKFDGTINEVNIKKCSNPKCRHQYLLKQLLDSKLKIVHNSQILVPVSSIEEIEEIAIQYFENKYPLMDLSHDEDKSEINWWDMLQFVQHVLSSHCH